MHSPYALTHEMLEVPNLLRHFDPHVVECWLPVLQARQKILLTGEGSSRIFPAKNMIAKAWQQGNQRWALHTEGGRQAMAYDLGYTSVIGVSNSGQTRELIELFTALQGRDIPLFGVTAHADSKLTTLCEQNIVLTVGKEEAVAATKTVVEQALVYQALLQGKEWAHQHQAADLCEQVLSQPVPSAITEKLAKASMIYFAGRNDGVAEELTLKTNEITRLKSAYLEGTYVVHGIEEIMQPSDVLILIDPFPAELAKIQQVIEQNIGMTVIAIAAEDTIFPTLKIPKLEGFDAYFQLLAGWTLLVAIGLHNGIDLDKPTRARKVGNAV